MRIALVSFSSLPTMQNYLYNTAESLERSGLCAATLGSEPLCDRRRELGARSYLVGAPESPSPSISSAMMFLRNARYILRQLRDWSPDVVHFVSAHSWNLPLALWVRLRLRSAVLHTFHDPLGHEGDKARFSVELYNRVLLRAVSGVVVHSEKSRREVLEQLGASVPVYSAPLASTRWRPFSRHAGATRRALFFGRLNRYKGLSELAAIAAHLQSVQPDVTIVVAGKPSPDCPRDELSRLEGLRNVLLRLEAIPEEELDQYFYDCDCVLITHTSITQSGVILDAYAHSQPIVCFDIPGIAEFLPREIRPIPAFDVAAFAQKVADICSSPDSSRTLAVAAWEFGRREFSEDRIVAELRSAYEAILAETDFE